MLNFSKSVNEIFYSRKFLLNFSQHHSRNKSKNINNYRQKTKDKNVLKEEDIINDGELKRGSGKNGNRLSKYGVKCESRRCKQKLRVCQHTAYLSKGKFNKYCEQFFSLFKLRSTDNNVLFQCNRNYKNLQLKCNYCSDLPRKVCHPRGTVCPTEKCKPYVSPKKRHDDSFSLMALRFILLLATLVSSGTIYYILYKQRERGSKKEEDESNADYHTKKGQQMRTEMIFERNPCCSGEIPKEVPYIMVGGGAAASAACTAIRQKEPDAKILIFMNEPYRPYRRVPLSKIMIYHKDRELAKKFQYTDKSGTLHSLYYEREGYYIEPKDLPDAENGGVACAHGWPVVKVDPAKKEITLDDGKKIKYTKKCLLATGASPNQLEVINELPQDMLKQISYYGGLYDFKKLEEIIENGADSVAIFGGGFLGCELSSALAKRSKGTELKITHIIREECVMDFILPKYVTRWLTKNVLDKSGITFINNASILNVDMNRDGKLELALSNDRKVVCDHLLVCVGSVANTDLARVSGLEVCKQTQAFVANEELQVRTDLFTAGDCGSFYDSFLDERINVRHHDYALYTGKLAGENMTGAAKSIEHQAIYFSEIGVTMDYEVVGYTNVDLPTVGVFTVKKLDTDKTPSLPEDIDYSRGVIFYLKEDMIVGAVLWNVSNRLPMVRRIIMDKKTYKDLNDIVKMLELHNS